MGPEVIVPGIMMLIPIVAIVGSYFLKYKKMEFARQDALRGNDTHIQELSAEMLKELKTLRAANETLTQRMNSMERMLGQGAMSASPYGEAGEKDAFTRESR